MNVKQLVILTAVVVGLVFLITFAFQYIGQEKTSKTEKSKVTQAKPLTFPVTKVEWDPKKPAIHEVRAPGQHYFWFQNDNDAPAQLGLVGMNCKCSKVDLCVLPAETWKGLSPEQRELPAINSDLSWQALPELRADPKGIEVPPRAAGWVRLGWKGEKAGPETLKADLWMQAPSRDIEPLPLEMPVLFVEPVACHAETGVEVTEQWLGKLETGETAQVTFLYRSATRRDFSLEPAEATTKLPFEMDKPEKLNEEECKKLAEKYQVPVLCAYKVRVKVSEQNTQLDLGLFRYRVILKSDANPEPLTVFVSGEVEGPVRLVTEDGRSRIDLGPFSARADKGLEISLATDDPSLELRIDRAKTAPFFKLGEPKEEKGRAARTWHIEGTIPARSLEGPFPNRDKLGYEDTAVYLTIHRKDDKGVVSEKSWRRIRVLVVGNATAR